MSSSPLKEEALHNSPLKPKKTKSSRYPKSQRNLLSNSITRVRASRSIALLRKRLLTEDKSIMPSGLKRKS